MPLVPCLITSSGSDPTKVLAALLCDQNYLKITDRLRRPNIFQILGRTHTETWHSMFLAWLLNPAGSHGQGALPLRLFCDLAARNCSSPEHQRLWRRLSLQVDGDAATQVEPDSDGAGEHRYDDGSRADVRLTKVALPDPSTAALDSHRPPSRPTIVIEEKVRDPVDHDQLDLYVEHEKASQSPTVFCLVAPQSSIRNRSSLPHPWATVCLEELTDIIHRILADPERCNSHTTTILRDYMLNLESTGATSPELRKLVRSIYEEHQQALSLIGRILAEDPDASPDQQSTGMALADGPGKPEEFLAMSVRGVHIAGDTSKEFMLRLLEHLRCGPGLEAIKIPWKTSKKRYFIAKIPVHPPESGGRSFYSPLSYEPLGWYLEMNRSRESTLGLAQELVDKAFKQSGG